MEILVQCESSEIKPNDCKKHYLRHGFNEPEAPNYVYIYIVGAFDRIQIKIKPLNTVMPAGKFIPHIPQNWIRLNVDNHKGLSHRSACSRPFTFVWEYCKKYGINILAELKAHQIRLKTAKSGKVFDVTPSSKTREASTNRPETSQASQRRSHKRGKSADTRSSDTNVNIPNNDENNLAKKVLRRSQYH